MSDANADKKTNLFAKLAMHNAKGSGEDVPVAATEEVPSLAVPPSPALPPAARRKRLPASKPEPAKGKRQDPDYCQANAYVPKSVQRAVHKALLDIEGLDYSSLVTDLLRKWVKSRSVAE